MISNIFAILTEITADCNNKPYIYGGFVRDTLAKLPFNDIDIRVFDRNTSTKFISKLEEKYDIRILKCNYDGSISIKIISKETDEFVNFDITFCTERNNIVHDFDVNMFYTTTLSEKITNNIERLNEHCNRFNTLLHIINHEFVILNSFGYPTIEHLNPTMVFDPVTCVIRYSDNRRYSSCIRRSSLQGRKLRERRKKMERKGWKCLNKDCQNPECVLAPDSLVIEYNNYLHGFMKVNGKLPESSSHCDEL